MKDYNACYEQLNLGLAYLTVHNRKARVKRSLDRLKKNLETSAFARNTLKQYFKIARLEGIVKTRARHLIVLPFMLNKIVRLYNGRYYQQVKPTEEALGRYLSEFVLTRKKGAHSKKGLRPVKRT